jgi:hypothetical protein
MRKFFIKILLLALPFAVLLSFPITIYYLAGEFISGDDAIKIQQKDPAIIYGKAYSDETSYIKVTLLQSMKPDVVALGNSRILTMRREFFDPTISFYNAGGTTPDITSFRKFLTETKIHPKIIIMVVEPAHFNPLLKINTNQNSPLYTKENYVLWLINTINHTWFRFYQDYVNKKIDIEKITKDRTQSIGINAIMTGSGTRYDGSRSYGTQYNDIRVTKTLIDNEVKNITSKKDTETPQTASGDALIELDRFLELCKNENIYVIGYIPPTPERIIKAYHSQKQYNYIFETYDKTLPIFKKYNFQLFDFYSLKSLNADENEAIDASHTSEKVMVRALIYMSKTDSVLKNVLSKNLNTMLIHTTNKNNVLQ